MSFSTKLYTPLLFPLFLDSWFSSISLGVQLSDDRTEYPQQLRNKYHSYFALIVINKYKNFRNLISFFSMCICENLPPCKSFTHFQLFVHVLLKQQTQVQKHH